MPDNKDIANLSYNTHINGIRIDSITQIIMLLAPSKKIYYSINVINVLLQSGFEVNITIDNTVKESGTYIISPY